MKEYTYENFLEIINGENANKEPMSISEFIEYASRLNDDTLLDLYKSKVFDGLDKSAKTDLFKEAFKHYAQDKNIEQEGDFEQESNIKMNMLVKATEKLCFEDIFNDSWKGELIKSEYMELIKQFPLPVAKQYIQYMKEKLPTIKSTASYNRCLIMGGESRVKRVKRLVDNLSNDNFLLLSKDVRELVDYVKDNNKGFFDAFSDIGIIESMDETTKMYEDINNTEIGKDYKVDRASIHQITQNRDLYERKASMMLENDPEAQVDDEFLAMLEQLSKKNLMLSNVHNQFKNNMKKFEAPDMSRYESDIEGLSNMDETTFANFMRDLKTYKLAKGMIPEQYCDYLIKLKLDSDSVLSKNIDTYFPMFKRAFEDKGHHVLKKNNTRDCCVCISSKLEENTLGLAGLNFIEIKDEDLKNLSINNISALDTLYHEVRHAEQRDRVLGQNIIRTERDYLMLLENIIRNEDPDYYKDNYLFMYCEIDARIAGRRGTMQLLKQLGYGEKEVFDYDGKNVVENYAESQRKDQDLYKELSREKLFEGEYQNIKTIILETFKNIKCEKIPSGEKTKLQYYFEQYPILRYEFNERGEKRPTTDVLNIFEEHFEKAKAGEYKSRDEKPDFAILGTIIRNSKDVYRSARHEDTVALSKHTITDPLIKTYRDIIVRREMIPHLDRWLGRKDEYCLYLNEKPEKILNNYKELVESAYQFIKNNPDEEVTKEVIAVVEKYKDIIAESNVMKSDDTEKAKAEVKGLEQIDKTVKPEERSRAEAHVISKIQNSKIQNQRKETKDDREIR